MFIYSYLKQETHREMRIPKRDVTYSVLSVYIRHGHLLDVHDIRLSTGSQ